MSDISREEVISKLKDLLLKIEDPTDTKLGWLETWVTKEDIEAIKYAISSIKTDLKYDLMYENNEVYSKADMLSLLKDIKADIANISEKSSICDDTYCYGYRDKLASDYKTEVLEVIDKKISDMENKK